VHGLGDTITSLSSFLGEGTLLRCEPGQEAEWKNPWKTMI
jgi:hypothetical protein